MSNKHKHYDMIVAKAANMDLVVLFKAGDKWVESSGSTMAAFHPSTEYFLCLPQHKEACLHWLNGGELNIDNGKGLGVGRYTLSIKNNFPLSDFVNHHEYTFTIKPKKEKRWIATLNGWNASRKVFASKQEAVGLLGTYGYQFHEIEVEV